MKISRREFTRRSAAAALLGGAVGFRPVSGSQIGRATSQSHPNILLLMTDQQQLPPVGYGPGEGAVQGLKEILGFRTLSPDNAYPPFFPAMLRLRRNGVVFTTNYTPAAACAPGRACIMTGSYKKNVDQETDQMFKTIYDVTWLDPYGTPTIGDWFRAAGYKTYYYGKWHVAHPETFGLPADSLEQWGFADWEKSYPEAHGGSRYNIGLYRDVGFADNVVTFLKQRAAEGTNVPWLAVGSVVNPHDNGAYPWGAPGNAGPVPWQPFNRPPGIPHKGQKSLPNPDGLIVELNPDGFPQDTFGLPPTFAESLDDKPRCQKDYSYKYGLAWGSKMRGSGLDSPYPFQIWGKTFGGDPAAWFRAFGQFYMYCHYLADRQLWRMLQALDGYGFTNNTIVVFLPDHGEVGGAHGGMIQKFHNAYEETIRVPMVVSSPLVNSSVQEMRVIQQPTSSIDLAPTLLGLAGLDQNKLRSNLQASHSRPVEALVGADLSPYARGEKTGAIIGPDGKARKGVLFVSNDLVTELGPNDTDPTDEMHAYYANFTAEVDKAIAAGYPLAPGSVTQPNHLRALCTGDWKIVRYTDPSGAKADEWELYCLTADPIEKTNLVDFRTGEVRSDVSVPGYTTYDLILKNQELKKELAQQEAAYIGHRQVSIAA